MKHNIKQCVYTALPCLLIVHAWFQLRAGRISWVLRRI